MITEKKQKRTKKNKKLPEEQRTQGIESIIWIISLTEINLKLFWLKKKLGLNSLGPLCLLQVAVFSGIPHLPIFVALGSMAIVKSKSKKRPGYHRIHPPTHSQLLSKWLKHDKMLLYWTKGKNQLAIISAKIEKDLGTFLKCQIYWSIWFPLNIFSFNLNFFPKYAPFKELSLNCKEQP